LAVCLITRFMLYLYFFFFQAEDGIRDLIVTRVQTCALPISEIAPTCAISLLVVHGLLIFLSSSVTAMTALSMPRLRSMGFMPARSEERRVGKECRWRWGRDC